MKHNGIKYKRMVAPGLPACALCDIMWTTNCYRLGKCIRKDHRKGNRGYYKEVS